MNHIYFELADGRIVTDWDIVQSAYIVTGQDIDLYDLAGIREFAAGLSTVICEITPTMDTIKNLVKNNRLILAVKMYRDIHPDASLRAAKDIIDGIREDIAKC